MDTKEEFGKVSTIVEYLMTQDERCRNDDKWLTYQVMRHFTKIYIPFEDFARIPAFETIKRVRAKIQNVDKRLLPTDEKVRRKRQGREYDVKEWLRDKK